MRNNWVSIFLLMLFACGDANQENLIPRADFEKILLQYHMLEAEKNMRVKKEQKRTEDVIREQKVLLPPDSVPAMYGYSSEDFKKTFEWYSTDFEVLQEIYDSLSRRVERFRKQTDTSHVRVYSFPFDINEKQFLSDSVAE